MSEQQKMEQEQAAFQDFWMDESSAELRKSCARGWAQYIWQARASLPVGVPDGYMPIPTAEQIADALENVRCFHDMSAELIAPELLANLLAVTTVKESLSVAPSLPAAGSADQQYPDGIADDLERSDWTPIEALQWYATGKHFDVVGGRTRIIDTGAVASNALKHASLAYLELKGDAELSELRAALSARRQAQRHA